MFARKALICAIDNIPSFTNEVHGKFSFQNARSHTLNALKPTESKTTVASF